MGRKTLFVLSLAGAALALQGCSSVRSTFGFDRTIPDEFAVVTRAPLSMPPNFTLEPPQPGAPRPQEAVAPERGRSALTGGTQVADAPQTSGEDVLLGAAGARGVDPGIREVVNREATAELEGSRSFIDSIIFWRDPDQPGTVVDPGAEARRLATNQAQGVAPSQGGPTPVIERRERAPLEGLFDGIFPIF